MTRLPGSVPPALHSLLTEAESLATRRDFNGALARYEQVLASAPNEPYTLVQMSYIHSLLGSYRRAENYALAAAATRSIDPQILGELLPRLRTFNQIPEMLACIERALPMSRMPIPMLISVAAQLSYANLPDRALKFLDEARRADPDYPSTLLARAQVLTYLGRFDEAADDIKRSMRRAPEIAQGHWLQAWVSRQTKDRNHVAAIQRELARPGRSPNDIALLSFALHKELDDLGDYSGAWSALVQGCRAKRSRSSYDTGATRALVAELAKFEALRIPDATADSAAPTPIFIVGMHRSGTTLLEQLLAGHSSIAALGELYDFTSAMRFVTDHHCKGVIDQTIVERASTIDLREAGARYLTGLAWRIEGAGYFTDKLPSNFLNVGFIAHALPNAKILHMVRDPIETCFSNLRELFSDANAYSYDLGELADYYLLYLEVMDAWRARFRGRILDVEYARLVAKPEEELRRVAGFCGLPFESSMLDMRARQSVVTASAVQVRNRIEAREKPKWLPYESFLAPLIEKLQPVSR